ncbi:MAG: hypothetical protein GX330_08160 [Bacteroidales bacterium]|nr:hypothetical protein [Bacteroidales bacterium]
MKKNKVNLRQIMILFFAIGLMTSCSKQVYESSVIQQLKQIKNVDFDKNENMNQFKTKDYDAALNWNQEEINNGRMVSIRLNKETGEYICKSIPKTAVSLPTEEEIIDLLDENGEFILEDED